MIKKISEVLPILFKSTCTLIRQQKSPLIPMSCLMTNLKYLLKAMKMVMIYIEEFTKNFSNFVHRKVLPLFTNTRPGNSGTGRVLAKKISCQVTDA